MEFLFYYTILIRAAVVVTTLVQIFKRKYNKIFNGVITIALTFIPWLLSLIDIRLNGFTVFLFQTDVFLAVFLGLGYKYYDLLPWLDRFVHFLSGVFFFGFGMALSEKEPGVGLTGSLIFSFATSLAFHEIWEVFEFLSDSLFRTDHQRWQKKSSVINHQPGRAMQPPGLADTMSDAISNIIGAILACLGWWIYLTRT